MCHLTSHRGPGLIPLCLSELLSGIIEVVDHQIVGPHEAGDFIVLLVHDIFKIIDAGLIHLVAYLGNRTEHLVHGPRSYHPGQDEQY